MKEHEQMLDAIVARDGSAARRVLVEHLLRKRDVVLDLMRRGESQSPLGTEPATT